MGMLHFLGRVLLVVINLILVLISLALVVFGFLIKFSGDTFKSYTEPVIKKITSSVEGAFGSSDFNAENFDIAEMFSTTATLLIAIGFVLLIISFFGACGACCDTKCMLMGYALILIVLLIAQIALAVFIFGYPTVLNGLMKKPLKTLLKNYNGLNGTNVESMVWNFVMIEFQCCGLENSGDFKSGHTSWFGEDDTDWMTPVACCKTLPESAADFDCAKADGNDATKNNFDKGCVDEIWSYLIDENQSIAYIAVGGALVFQIMMVVFALLLYCKDDGKVQPFDGGNNRRHNQRRHDPRGAW